MTRQVDEVDQRHWARVQRKFDEYMWLMESDQMTPGQRREFNEFYAKTVASMRHSAGVRKRVLAIGDGWFSTPLRTGGRGFLQRRSDDCLQAALATLAQIPPAQVPDLGIDRQRTAGVDIELIERRCDEALERWSDRFGLRLISHASPPWTAKLWIGVVPSMADYSDHCLLMSGIDVVFDPAQVLPGDEFELEADDIAYGLTIERN